MPSSNSGREKTAVQHLERLAEQLRGLGLTVMALAPDRSSFPALLVDAGTTKAVIMAGAAHFWRRAASGDMRFVAPLDEPKKAARVVHGFLTEVPERRRSRRSRFRERAPVGRMRQVAVVVGVPVVAVPAVIR